MQTPGEELVGEYLRHIRGCEFVQYNLQTSEVQGEIDVIGLQAVTVGQRASEVARSWFEQDRYQDYVFLHGLSVEIAEASAEYVHSGRVSPKAMT